MRRQRLLGLGHLICRSRKQLSVLLEFGILCLRGVCWRSHHQYPGIQNVRACRHYAVVQFVVVLLEISLDSNGRKVLLTYEDQTCPLGSKYKYASQIVLQSSPPVLKMSYFLELLTVELSLTCNYLSKGNLSFIMTHVWKISKFYNCIFSDVTQITQTLTCIN